MSVPDFTPEGRLILLFASIHDVLAAEALARAHGVWCDLVPAPRELSSECGMVLELETAGWERLAEAGVTWRNLHGAYKRMGAGYQPL